MKSLCKRKHAVCWYQPVRPVWPEVGRNSVLALVGCCGLWCVGVRVWGRGFLPVVVARPWGFVLSCSCFRAHDTSHKVCSSLCICVRGSLEWKASPTEFRISTSRLLSGCPPKYGESSCLLLWEHSVGEVCCLALVSSQGTHPCSICWRARAL